MYKARLWTIDEARAEAAYIASVNPCQPGPNFNNDPRCFARYANMQANHALASSYPLLAHDKRSAAIANARDKLPSPDKLNGEAFERIGNPDTYQAFRAALADSDGQYWDDRLRDAGFLVWQAI